jgi:hypothetical protein
VVISNNATGAAMSAMLTTRALWGVFSNGEFGAGSTPGWPFRPD